MRYWNSIPAWEAGDIDLAFVEGCDESHLNGVGFCPKCGTVCSRDWCCEWCGSDLEGCMPLLTVAVTKSSGKPEPWPWRPRPPAREFENRPLIDDDEPVIPVTRPKELRKEPVGPKRLRKEPVGLFAFRFFDIG